MVCVFFEVRTELLISTYLKENTYHRQCKDLSANVFFEVRTELLSSKFRVLELEGLSHVHWKTLSNKLHSSDIFRNYPVSSGYDAQYCALIHASAISFQTFVGKRDVRRKPFCAATERSQSYAQYVVLVSLLDWRC
jgi:hypothetical protein